jgi:hypothetical protein
VNLADHGLPVEAVICQLLNVATVESLLVPNMRDGRTDPCEERA